MKIQMITMSSVKKFKMEETTIKFRNSFFCHRISSTAEEIRVDEWGENEEQSSHSAQKLMKFFTT
jgi:hypothetical protein